MSLRRLILIVGLLGLLTSYIFSLDGWRGEETTRIYAAPRAEAGVAGQWLRLFKSPDHSYVNRGAAVRFTIVVLNTSPDDALRDVAVSDPLTPDCNRPDIGMLPAEGEYSYSCTYENVQVPFSNEAVVSGINNSNEQPDSTSDTARVDILELNATIDTSADTVAAPGGPIRFTVTITNASSVDVQLTSLISPQLGDLTDSLNSNLEDNTCAVEAGLPLLGSDGDSIQCAFTSDVIGLPGDYSFNVNASGVVENTSVNVSGSGTTVVKIYEIISASLTADRDHVLPGEAVDLTVAIQNLGDSESVRILTIEDATLGDVTLFGDCELPQLLDVGEAYSCQYEQTSTAAIGEEQSYILTVAGETAADPPVALGDQASATVEVIEPIVLLPMVTLVPQPTSCTAPLFIDIDTVYQFYPDTEHAIYWFALADTTDVVVELMNFLPEEGQIAIYKDTGKGCDPASLEDIGFDGSSDIDRTLAVGAQEAGNYYVYIFSGADLGREQAYSLLVRTR